MDLYDLVSREYNRIYRSSELWLKGFSSLPLLETGTVITATPFTLAGERAQKDIIIGFPKRNVITHHRERKYT